MTNHSFPHHRLQVFGLSVELVRAVGRARIEDARLREQARKSAASAALNCAEGAARESVADKKRVLRIARAEACEAVAAVEIAHAMGACGEQDLEAVLAIGAHVDNVLRKLTS